MVGFTKKTMIILSILLPLMTTCVIGGFDLPSIGDKAILDYAPTEPAGGLGYKNINDWVKFVLYVMQNDEKAQKLLLEKMRASGTSTRFNVGEVVYCVDIDKTGDHAKVRRGGELEEFWVYRYDLRRSE